MEKTHFRSKNVRVIGSYDYQNAHVRLEINFGEGYKVVSRVEYTYEAKKSLISEAKEYALLTK